jgi:endoplasmic reticulum chaperone BiP
MIREAEENSEEDKKVKERIDAKNAFDGYLSSLKSAVEGSLAEKIDDEDKEKVGRLS